MKRLRMNQSKVLHAGFRLAFSALLFAGLTLALASAGHAQATRTWVSGVGDDANPCSRTAPCKTFAGAISKTAANGEIDALDPGGFGAVTITKSITLDGTGTLGSILASGTTGIVINITNKADTAKSVKIRGLTINGAATGINGINIIAANQVSVEGCIIDGFTKNGINAAAGMLFVKNCSIRSNANAGIFVGAGVTLGIVGTTLTFNGTATDTEKRADGPPAVINQLGNVVMFGNKTGDPKR